MLREALTRRAIHAVRNPFSAAKHCSLNPEQGERARSASYVKNAQDQCLFGLKPRVVNGYGSRGSSLEYLPRISWKLMD